MPTIKTSREEVILKATHVIRQRGYVYSSMKDLAEACEIQPSHFYYYFKSKEDLMTAVLENILFLFRKNAASVLQDDTLSPSEKLDKMLRRMAKAFQYTEGGCLMGNTVLETAYLEPQFIGVLRDFFNEFIEALAQLYRFKFTEIYARGLAEQSVQDLEGGIMLAVLFRDDKYILNAFQRAKAHLS